MIIGVDSFQMDHVWVHNNFALTGACLTIIDVTNSLITNSLMTKNSGDGHGLVDHPLLACPLPSPSSSHRLTFC
jgi:hypothetical protein